MRHILTEAAALVAFIALCAALLGWAEILPVIVPNGANWS